MKRLTTVLCSMTSQRQCMAKHAANDYCDLSVVLYQQQSSHSIQLYRVLYISIQSFILLYILPVIHVLKKFRS